MKRSNVLSLRFCTTDMNGSIAKCEICAERIREAGTGPPQSLPGVNRLVLPELLVEIEAGADD